jgi:hypothetical protein
MVIWNITSQGNRNQIQELFRLGLSTHLSGALEHGEPKALIRLMEIVDAGLESEQDD